MNIKEYFESLTNELHSLKNRIRNFIDNNHQLTDGEWKESVLRSIIRRHLPANIEVGRGFIVKGEKPSRQTDILFYDNTKPALFRDGDFLFITPDATKGIIEVKTKIDSVSNLKQILNKMADKSQFILESDHIRLNQYRKPFFCGVFAYEAKLDSRHYQEILEIVKAVSKNNPCRIINHICLGENLFIKFWKDSPESFECDYNKWHCYYLYGISPGYFINNIVYTFSKSVGINQEVWFPKGGKEGYKLGEIKFGRD